MGKLVKTALCLLLCALLSLPALAEVVETSKPLTNGAYATSGDYTYTLLEDGGARIIDYVGDAETLTIPAELDGHSVRQIGDRAFTACFSLTSVTLPEGLTAIGEEAFQRCESLTAIALPEGLTAIGDNAFFSCGLTSIALPDSLTTMGANPFLGCSSLAAIDISPDHPVFAQADGVLYEKASGTLICYPAGKADDSFAVPEGTLSIGDDAFAGCFSLTSIALPEGLTSIGEGAFVGCFFLRTIALPDSLTTIGDSAFMACFALSAVALPEGLTSIDEDAFAGCLGLTAVTLPEGLTSIGEDAFAGCAALTAVALPDSLTSIGEGAFDGCSDTLTLTVPRDSYACQYAIDNGIPYTCSDANG